MSTKFSIFIRLVLALIMTPFSHSASAQDRAKLAVYSFIDPTATGLAKHLRSKIEAALARSILRGQPLVASALSRP